ncbi:ubiquitin-like small modifier protein 1 [Haladaptatus sp. DYSN1]|uniref:ubiquitin-like small modifier protein 1 n=1 Tax=unclassified Haladaptatus TaxID=2622732 RepID=UPI002406A577|nr:ubiquitin-like small modifier protein 1 [Haladaptatus sp. DYSN1]
MNIEVNLFGPFREAVGEKTVRRELPDGATVADLFAELADAHPDLEGRVLTTEGDLSGAVTVTKNGKPVSLFDGPATELTDGDVIRAAPPVHGG